MTPAQAREHLGALELFLGGTCARQWLGDHICLAEQPRTPYGTPDELVDRGVAAAARATAAWGQVVVDALAGATSESAVRSTLSRISERLRLEDVVDVVHEETLRGALLGSADSQWERVNDIEVAPARFDEHDTGPSISGAPHESAIRLWRERQVLSPEAFRALDDGMRRRAFTVAGMARADLLDTVHAELGRMIAVGASHVKEGPDFRQFSKFVDKRLKTAGWTPANPSHVETIFRTNIMSAYSAGRFAEQNQPHVLAALPYWQIRTVKDSRQRATHRAADGVILPANHAFWRHAYPPFGYNCRCRVCSRSQAWVTANSAKVGPPPLDLPDPGFTSGTSTLVQVPAAALEQKPKVSGVPAPPAPAQQAPSLGPASPFPAVAPSSLPVLPGPAPALPPIAPSAPSPSFVLPKPGELPSALPEPPVDFLAKKISAATGSNPGGVYEGDDGVQRYVKFYGDPAQAIGEHLANSIYSDLGLGTVKSEVFEHQGQIAYASELIPGAKPINDSFTAANARKALTGFAADVLVANWDAAGLGLDNMLVSKGKIIRIDNGGAFLSRAQGARKPAVALTNVTEWETLFDPTKNPGYAKLAAKAGVSGPADLAPSIKAVTAKIRQLRDKAGGWAAYVEKRAAGINPIDRDQIVRMLDARTSFLEQKAAELKVVKKAAGAAELAPITETEIADTRRRYIGKVKATAAWLEKHPGIGALKSYTGSAYTEMNGVLAGRKAPLSPDGLAIVQQRITEVQTLLTDAAAAGHAIEGTLFRGMSVDDATLRRLLTEDVIEFKAFTSISVSQEIAAGFANPRSGRPNRVILRVRQRAAIPIDKVSVNEGEAEALLPHSTKHQRIAHEVRDGVTWIDLVQQL